MSSWKRHRPDEASSLIESFTALLRQAASRAVQRLELQMGGRAPGTYSRYGHSSSPSSGPAAGGGSNGGGRRTVQPMDRLVIVFCMYYFSVSDLVPPHHPLLFAQGLVTRSELRVRRASQSFFDPPSRIVRRSFLSGSTSALASRNSSPSSSSSSSGSLAQFCEMLVEESDAGPVGQAVEELEDFIQFREHLGAFILEGGGANRAEENDEEASHRGIDSDRHSRRRRAAGKKGKGGRRSGWNAEEDEDEDEDEDEAWEDDEDPDDNGGAAAGIHTVDRERNGALLTRLYEALEYFIRVRVFLLAISRDAAAAQVSDDAAWKNGSRGNQKGALTTRVSSSSSVSQAPRSCTFHPRYEQQLLMRLLKGAGGGAPTRTAPWSRTSPPPPRLPNALDSDAGGATSPRSHDHEALKQDGEDVQRVAGPDPNTAEARDGPPPPLALVKPEPNDEEAEDAGLPTPSGLKREATTEDVWGEGETRTTTSSRSETQHGLSQRVVVEEPHEPEQRVGTPTAMSSVAAVVSEEEEEFRAAVATALLTDLLALSHLPAPSTTTTTTPAALPPPPIALSDAALRKIRGLDPRYYELLHTRLSVMVARQQLHRFGRRFTGEAPPLTDVQQSIIEEETEAMAAQHRETMLRGMGGVAVDFVPDSAYYQRMLIEAYGLGGGEESEAQQQQQEEEEENEDVASASPRLPGLGTSEELFTDEVLDYYKRQQEHAARQREARHDAPASSRGRPAASAQRGRGRGVETSAVYGEGGHDDGTANPSSTTLVKPDRVCKVKTGFSWTQYNRTHYDSRMNPPPKRVMWYEFTLYYRALANTKRDPRTFFRIEDTPLGPTDPFCLLVFSVGPPYADVAYRIVRQQWDTRPGGVRMDFDATGKFRLFFRLSNSNYRR